MTKIISFVIQNYYSSLFFCIIELVKKSLNYLLHDGFTCPVQPVLPSDQERRKNENTLGMQTMDKSLELDIPIFFCIKNSINRQTYLATLVAGQTVLPGHEEKGVHGVGGQMGRHFNLKNEGTKFTFCPSYVGRLRNVWNGTKNPNNAAALHPKRIR